MTCDFSLHSLVNQKSARNVHHCTMSYIICQVPHPKYYDCSVVQGLLLDQVFSAFIT